MNQSIEGFPFSPQQKHLYLLEQFDSSPFYRSMTLLYVEGTVDADKLRDAARGVAERHEILRTKFVRPAGVKLPLQVIDDALQPEFEIRQVKEDGEVASLALEAAKRPFDLEKGPLVRFTLFASGSGKYFLAISAPALVADARALRNVVADLVALYGGEGELEDPLQYADFAAWQAEQLESTDADAAKAKEFWKAFDPASLPAMTLPNEKRLDAHPTFAPLGHPVMIEASLVDRLEAVAAKHDAPPNVALLAAWQAFIWRLTGQTDVVVGAVTEARTQDEMVAAIGSFAKTLPVVAKLEGTITYSELVKETRRVWGDATRHQDHLPFDENAAAGGHLALGVGFELGERAKRRGGGIALVTLHEMSHVSRFAIKLSCARGESLGFSGPTTASFLLFFDPALFDHDTIGKLASHFATFVKSIADKPDAPLSTLDLLTADEKKHLLEDLNNTRAEYAVDRPIHAMIEAQATKFAGKVAVMCGGASLSYGDLDGRANQIANHLISLGMGPGSLVGICVERSIDMVVGILGILKTGATYVPLDPEYPKDRRAFVLEDAKVPLLLTQSHLLADLPSHAAKVLCFDADRATFDACSTDRPATRGAVSDVAYLIYTSGTTGNPRGVMITHGNLCHYVQAIGPALEISDRDHYLHTASIAFSSSVRQLMVPLAHGSTVVVATSEERRDPLAMFQTMKRDRVTVIDLVPSHWRACNQVIAGLSESARKDLLDNSLRLVASASEALWSDIPATFRRVFGHPAKLTNMFGQTETTGIVSTYPIPENEPERTHIVPLGRPFKGSRIYILDQHLQPVPFGVTGELFVGGLGVGKGYLNQPERTAEKFLKDPYAGDDKAMMYRTGDRARYLPGANIEFLGRSDNMVKIRGFRIELGEIEVTLGSHPSLREAVVAAREDEPGDRRLVAYVIPKGAKADVKTADLRAFLGEKLPSYMVPAAFVVLDAFPMTPNGKVDRKNLPAPAQAGVTDHAHVEPRNIVEDALAGIWAEVLNAKKVGVTDNFFELGGHSLLATQLISRVRDTFKVELAVRSLFEATTVAEQAAVLLQNESKPGLVEKIAKVVKKIQSMSADEAKQALAAKKA